MKSGTSKTKLAENAVCAPPSNLNSTRSQITLPDGRTLSYYYYHGGDQNKKRETVVFVHGFPGSGLQGGLLWPAMSERAVDVVAPDRPGFGESSDYEGRKFSDWPADLKFLLDHLQVKKARMFAISGGTPYGLAAAIALPERTIDLTVVSGMGSIDEPNALQSMAPGNRVLLEAANTWPRLTRIVTWFICSVWRVCPLSAGFWMWCAVDASDRRLFLVPRHIRFLVADVRAAAEAFSEAVEAVVRSPMAGLVRPERERR